MNKRILIPTDFSSTALNACKYAMDIYPQQACDFYLLNAYQISGYSVDSPFNPEPGDVAYQAACLKSEKALSELSELLSRYNSGRDCRFKVIASYNSLLHATEAGIAKYDIDLVVMGTKGITGAESLIFGTNAINLMEGIRSCPVLAIPEEYGFEPPDEIVFPTDFKVSFKRKELHSMIEIAGLHKAAIRVLHIQRSKKMSTEQSSNRELLSDILGETSHSFHMVKESRIHKAIGEFVNSRNSRMIAFINRKHNVFNTLLSRPLVKEIGYHYKIPMLALNHHT